MIRHNSLRLSGLPVLLGIGFAILVAISVGTLWLVNEAEDSANWVAHTFEVDGNLHSLLRFIRRAESGERGYIIRVSLKRVQSDGPLSWYRLTA